MTLSTDRGQSGWDMRPRRRSNDGSHIIVPILRAGILAREFCRHGAHAEVAAVFERSFHLRSGDMFVCVGEPAIGDGPLTLIADFAVSRSLTSLGLCPGQPAAISDRCIAIGESLELTFDGCVAWRQPRWPPSRSPRELNDLGRVMARRIAFESPQESLGRVFCPHEAGAGETPLARIARRRIARFESWLLGALAHVPMRSMQSGAADSVKLPLPIWGEGGGEGVTDGRRIIERSGPPHPTPLPEGEREQTELAARPAGHITASPVPIADLIGLGPGLTPSGDDFLVGALALLDALSERETHAALARAVAAMPRGLTSALSECLLKTAAAGHVGADLRCAVSAVVSGVPDQAVAAIRKIGHGSGWDMMVGILTALRVVASFRLNENAASRIGGSS